MPYPESLEVAGVALERWDARRHLPVLRTMAEDADVQRWIGVPRDDAALGSWSERFAEHWDTHGFGLWAARPAGAAAPAGAGWLGACHPRWHPEFAHEVELAWSVTRSLRGHGLATRAGQAAARACFDELRLERVIAFVNPENAPSLAVVDRLGMRRTGSTRDPADGVELLTFVLEAAG